jgi:hypothetical protein
MPRVDFCIIYPDPDGEMRCFRVKETFNGLLRAWLHTFESRVVYPVLGGVFGERKVLQAVPGNLFVQV